MKFLHCCIDFIQDHPDVREHVQVLQVPPAYLVSLDSLELLDPLVHNIMLAVYRSGSRIFKMCVGVINVAYMREEGVSLRTAIELGPSSKWHSDVW